MHHKFVYEYIKIYIKIHAKIVPACFGLTTILSEHIIDLSWIHFYYNNLLKYVVVDC